MYVQDFGLSEFCPIRDFVHLVLCPTRDLVLVGYYAFVILSNSGFVFQDFVHKRVNFGWQDNLFFSPAGIKKSLWKSAQFLRNAVERYDFFATQ